MTEQEKQTLNDDVPARATLFLEPRINEILSSVYDCQPQPLPVDINGESVTAFRVRRFSRDRFLLAPFNFQPVLKDHSAAIVRAIVNSASAASPKTTARIKLHHRLPDETVKAFELRSATDGVETLISLRGGLDEMISRMRPRHRSKFRSVARSAKSSGLSIRPITGSESIRQFYDVLLASYRDKHRMLPQPLSLFDRLLATGQKSRGVVGYGAFDNSAGRLAGAIIVLKDETQWCYGWGANDKRYERQEIGTLLIGHAIEAALQAGVDVFSLGMSALSQDNLRRYKRGWGGEEHEVITYYWREDPAPVDLHKDYTLAKKLISIAPLAVIRSVSPIAVKWLV